MIVLDINQDNFKGFLTRLFSESSSVSDIKTKFLKKIRAFLKQIKNMPSPHMKFLDKLKIIVMAYPL